MTTLGRVMAGGYKLVPGATGPSGAVTYKVQNAGTGLAVNGCRKRPLSAFEKAAGGLVLNGCSTVWFVPRATLAGVVPKPGDSIAADGALDRRARRERATGVGLQTFRCRKSMTMILPSGAYCEIREKATDAEGRLLLRVCLWATREANRAGLPPLVHEAFLFGVAAIEHSNLGAHLAERIDNFWRQRLGKKDFGDFAREIQRGPDLHGFLAHPHVQAIEVTPSGVTPSEARQ